MSFQFHGSDVHEPLPTSFQWIVVNFNQFQVFVHSARCQFQSFPGFLFIPLEEKYTHKLNLYIQCISTNRRGFYRSADPKFLEPFFVWQNSTGCTVRIQLHWWLLAMMICAIPLFFIFFNKDLPYHHGPHACQILLLLLNLYTTITQTFDTFRIEPVSIHCFRCNKRSSQYHFR